jgi:hypothetical protein
MRGFFLNKKPHKILWDEDRHYVDKAGRTPPEFSNTVPGFAPQTKQ